jgi:hypothetical protein
VTWSRARQAVCTLAVLALLAGCTATETLREAPARAEPWPQRPVVDLSVEMAADLASATGRESVLFTPDLRVCELVFRAWPNKPTTAVEGTSLVVTDAAVDGRPVTPVVSAAGAPEGAPGTLVELPLPQCVEAGTQVRAELGYAVALGEDAGERVGHSPSAELAWFATAFPLLAWVRGAGWARDPAVDMFGETVTSEDFQLAGLSVTAPSAYRVLGTGTATGTSPGTAAGTTVHRFTADAVRDVAVSVGRFDVVERQVGDLRLHVGVPEQGSRVDADGWADQLAQMVKRLEGFLGPYPYPDLWASVLPPLADGVEFPTALQFGDVDRQTVPALVAHEVAHMWFYALVGNNQARNPWIDESFATYAQARAAGQTEYYQLSDVSDRVRGDLGEPMEYWAAEGGFGRYTRGVYDQGAAVLLEGRRRAGDDRFDEAMRAYVNTNAHRVVSPSDVEVAFQDLPEVTELLREHGALPSR